MSDSGFRRASRTLVWAVPPLVLLLAASEAALAAGTVTVARVAGGWEVAGDDSANVVTVRTSSATDGAVTVEILTDGATAVLGLRRFTLASRDGLRLRMGLGDDVVTLGGTDEGQSLQVPHSLRVDLGDGADELRATRAQTLRGPFLVQCGPGNDLVELVSCTSAGRLSILGRAGNDTISVTATGASTHATIDAGIGNDVVTLTDLTARAGVTLRGGAGTDTLRLAGFVDASAGRVFADAGTENDQVLATDATLRGALRVRGRAGNDTVAFSGVVCTKSAEFTGDSGDDLLTVGIAAETGGLRVAGGLGNDQVTLSSCRVARDVRVDLDDGTDRLATGTSHFDADVRYVGGAGADTLVPGTGDVVGGRLKTKGFESLD